MARKKYHIEIFVAERIKQLRLAKGLSQKAFADSLGIVQGYLSGIERGKKIPSHTFLIALCHVYGIQQEWLFGGEERENGEMEREKSHLTTRQIGRTPLLKRIPPEFPDEVREEVISDYVCLPETPEECFAIIAEGDYMAPTIRDGDLVIFKPGIELSNRSIVLLTNKWGEVILRRCRMQGTDTYFSPENNIYVPFKADANTRIFGTVTNIWRKAKI